MAMNQKERHTKYNLHDNMVCCQLNPFLNDDSYIVNTTLLFCGQSNMSALKLVEMLNDVGFFMMRYSLTRSNSTQFLSIRLNMNE